MVFGLGFYFFTLESDFEVDSDSLLYVVGVSLNSLSENPFSDDFSELDAELLFESLYSELDTDIEFDFEIDFAFELLSGSLIVESSSLEILIDSIGFITFS